MLCAEQLFVVLGKYKVEFVQKTSMYGYQADSQLFAQVWLRNPADVARVVTVLEVLRVACEMIGHCCLD